MSGTKWINEGVHGQSQLHVAIVRVKSNKWMTEQVSYPITHGFHIWQYLEANSVRLSNFIPDNKFNNSGLTFGHNSFHANHVSNKMSRKWPGCHMLGPKAEKIIHLSSGRAIPP